MTGEHLTPEFKIISPASTVPALIDGEVKIFESSAMAIYLVEKYGKDDSLYPKDLEKRTKVNEKLFYISGTVFPNMLQAFGAIWLDKAPEIPESCNEKFKRSYGTIEEMLQEAYLCGSNLTLADYFLWSIIESWDRFSPMDHEKYPKFGRWLERMRQNPLNSYQQEGVDIQYNFLKKLLEDNKKIGS